MKQSKITEIETSKLKTKLQQAVADIINDHINEDDTYNLKDYLQDLAKGGCQSGLVSELIYYTDTARFHDEHEEDIWDLLEEHGEMFGSKNVMSFITNLSGAGDVGSLAQFKNLLAWFAFEETARSIGLKYDIEL